MAIIECDITYCAICGAPIENSYLEEAWEDSPLWFSGFIATTVDMFNSEFKENTIHNKSNFKDKNTERYDDSHELSGYGDDESTVKLNWPNHSFGAADFQHENGWEHVDASKSCESDPINIAHVTEYTLIYLRPMPNGTKDDQETMKLIKNLANLPSELQLMVVEQLGSSRFENPALRCTRICLLDFWRELFIKVTPRLCDLEPPFLYVKKG
ncbi:hypothetical protein ABVK25_009726 [Lepraria finkii]|uniref:Uncharacterized protein n=1 Tax=Lepraria finkii TaxID=1340010 RepID=A0ABR4AZE5_9LECA